MTPSPNGNLYIPANYTFFPPVMMVKAVLADEPGRITLGTSVLRRYGSKFAVIHAAKEIVLVPIARNPAAKLAQMGAKGGIGRYTLQQLKERARKAAENEIMRANVCRH